VIFAAFYQHYIIEVEESVLKQRGDPIQVVQGLRQFLRASRYG